VRHKGDGTANSFETILGSELGEAADKASTSSDCVHFIQLGFLARVLQVLLGFFQQDLPSGGATMMEAQILIAVNEALSNPLISSWEKGCGLLLRAAFLKRLSHTPKKESGDIEEVGTDVFIRACQVAKDASISYLCNVGLILQVILPNSIYLFQNMVGSQKQSDDEFHQLTGVFGIGEIANLFDSSLVTEVISHWYENARPLEGLAHLSTLLDCRRLYTVNDWPNQSISEPFESKNIGGPIPRHPKKTLPLLGSPCASRNINEEDVRRIESLPVSYTDLYATLGSMLPDSELIAVCFVCGQVLDAGGNGECTKHSYECGGGCGIFFLLQDCVALAMHKDKAAYIPSPYVDSHGETPQYRGRPLNMDFSRYVFLHELWGGHMLREHVIAERSKSSTNRHLMIRTNYY